LILNSSILSIHDLAISSENTCEHSVVVVVSCFRNWETLVICYFFLWQEKN